MSPTAPDCPHSACSTQVNLFPENRQTQSWTFCLLGEILSGIVTGEQFIRRVFKGPYPTLKLAETGIGYGHLKQKVSAA